MGKLKAHEVEAWLAKKRPSVPVVLIYGPDRGMVSERAQAYAAGAGIPLDDPFSVVKLDAGDIDKDPGRLIDEVSTVSMFSASRLVWIRNAAAQRGLADAVKHVLATPPEAALVLIEAGDLKKNAPLRTQVENSAAGLALPCYADDARAIEALVSEEFQREGIEIEPEARQLLVASLGGDRLASRGEVRKLLLYAMGTPKVTVDDVRALTGDVSGLSVDDIVDATVDGDVRALDDAFSRQATVATQAQQILSAALRQFQALHLMRSTMEAERRNAGSVVAAARPPVFFKRQRPIEEALNALDRETIGRALERLHEAVLNSRRRAELALAITRHTLLAIAVERGRRGRSAR